MTRSSHHRRRGSPRKRSGIGSLGALLQARGFKVRLRKLDPYLNVDPGTMSPYQHGEVFVTDDGAETDLDLGITSVSQESQLVRATTLQPVGSIPTLSKSAAVII